MALGESMYRCCTNCRRYSAGFGAIENGLEDVRCTAAQGAGIEPNHH